eukprot:m.18855 g.18855  ORF g.18855 m.18855 type:complete len:309 (-) comp30514_c0_seq1:173-1099(-)
MRSSGGCLLWLLGLVYFLFVRAESLEPFVLLCKLIIRERSVRDGQIAFCLCCVGTITPLSQPDAQLDLVVDNLARRLVHEKDECFLAVGRLVCVIARFLVLEFFAVGDESVLIQFILKTLSLGPSLGLWKKVAQLLFLCRLISLTHEKPKGQKVRLLLRDGHIHPARRRVRIELHLRKLIDPQVGVGQNVENIDWVNVGPLGVLWYSFGLLKSLLNRLNLRMNVGFLLSRSLFDNGLCKPLLFTARMDQSLGDHVLCFVQPGKICCVHSLCGCCGVQEGQISSIQHSSSILFGSENLVLQQVHLLWQR